jgi:protoporphyrinogen oxidase
MSNHLKKRVVIIGGGPAGLTAAYELCKEGVESVVLEKDNTVGGLARTVKYKGYHFDIGGHRFYTKVKTVDEVWREVLPNGDFLRRKRLSRIYYDKNFFYYPIRVSNVLFNLGPWNSLLILLSYLKAKLFPEKSVETLDQYVSNHFGKRLYRIFFKTYTEKVWGIPCSEITAEWAAQRIKGLSFRTVLRSMFQTQAKYNGSVIKSLIDQFDYPRKGPGMMWETMADIIKERGGQVRLGAKVERFFWRNNRIDAVEVSNAGEKEVIEGTDFISSMPLREVIQRFEPPVPAEVLQAATNLNYRDFITVAVIINKCNVFPDNWIYVHEPDVKLGRIQNFKNWSPDMVPDSNKTCLGLEYFCFEGDGLWSMSDQELIELGKAELIKIGLLQACDFEDGVVIRVPKAYPVYDSTYKKFLQVVQQFLSGVDNLQTVGRNGMHKYNNQDHSMLTAMLAVKNIQGANHDIWKVNADPEYQEEIKHSDKKEANELALLEKTQPKVPQQKPVDVM